MCVMLFSFLEGTLDEIQAKMKDTILHNAIVWSNTSPQAVPNAIKQNNFTLQGIKQ